MNGKTLETVDEVMRTLATLSAIFDIMSAVDTPRLRDVTLSEFAEFMITTLDDLYQKVGSIPTKT
jgi:hypothetical protein